MERNRSLNTTNGLLAKMESIYVTTCFSLHLWPSSGYNLVAFILRFRFSFIFVIYNGDVSPQSRVCSSLHMKRVGGRPFLKRYGM